MRSEGCDADSYQINVVPKKVQYFLPKCRKSKSIKWNST